jgi:hypothetical protein
MSSETSTMIFRDYSAPPKKKDKNAVSPVNLYDKSLFSPTALIILFQKFFIAAILNVFHDYIATKNTNIPNTHSALNQCE